MLKKGGFQQIPEKNIILVYEPQEDGKYDITSLNFESVISNTPQLQKKCNIPLSSDAILKLKQINQQLNQSIERATAVFSNAVRRYYLKVHTSNLTITNKTMEQMYSVIVDGERELIKSENPKIFIQHIKDISSKIQTLGKIKFQYEQIYDFITKKYEQIDYIKDKINNFEFTMNNWIKNIRFQCCLFEKSENTTYIKDTDTLQVYLSNNLKMDINSDIKIQAHKFLNNPNIISASYSGSKTIPVLLTHEKTYSKNFQKPYEAEVKIGQYVRYRGTSYYSGSQAIRPSVRVKRCSCSSIWTPNGCLACQHYYFDVQKYVTAFYSGNVDYSGQTYYSGVQRQIFDAKFTDVIKQNVRIQYDENVPYSGNHKAQCKEHHSCSCQKLAEMVIAAKQIFSDISYYKKLVNFQRTELSRLKNQKNTPFKEDSGIIAILDQISVNGYKFISNNLTKNDIASQIHDQLATQHIFSAPYNGETIANLLKQYSDVYDCKGSIIITNKLTHSTNVPYSGSVTYDQAKNQSGTISVKSCYENCSWCNVSYSDEQYSHNYRVSGSIQYAGTVPFNKTYVHNHKLQYSEKVPYKGIIQKQQKVFYQGTNKVTCTSSKCMGSGHHSCTSCETWSIFVTGLKKLLSIKSGLQSLIKSNNQQIDAEVKKQQLKNIQLERQLLQKQLVYE